jgi:hypothetical protein
MAAREPIIYFVAGGDELIKIGHTTNLPTRLRSLRTATPKELRVLLVIPGMRDDEQNLHRRFEDHRAGREWFFRCDDITEFISAHRIFDSTGAVGDIHVGLVSYQFSREPFRDDFSTSASTPFESPNRPRC